MGDIVATTDNEVMIRRVYKHELPVTYDVPKPKKKIFTKEDLYQSDLFGFGSIIGSITNKNTAAYALLPLLEETYGEDSKEVQLTLSRLKQCCVAQSKQIDKTKIGQTVKGIPKDWVKRKKRDSYIGEEEWKNHELLNKCLLDKQPYFFKFRYPEAKKDYYAYESQKQYACRGLFGKSIKQLEEAPRKTKEQKQWLREYYEYCPLIVSNSPMNILCKYIESVDFNIAQRLKNDRGFDWRIYINQDYDYEDIYQDIVICYKRHIRDMARTRKLIADENTREMYLSEMEILRDKMQYVCQNPIVVTNALVKYLYGEAPSSKKTLLWDTYGKIMIHNLSLNTGRLIQFPMPDQDGDIMYMHRTYRMREVDVL